MHTLKDAELRYNKCVCFDVEGGGWGMGVGQRVDWCIRTVLQLPVNWDSPSSSVMTYPPLEGALWRMVTLNATRVCLLMKSGLFVETLFTCIGNVIRIKWDQGLGRRALDHPADELPVSPLFFLVSPDVSLRTESPNSVQSSGDYCGLFSGHTVRKVGFWHVRKKNVVFFVILLHLLATSSHCPSYACLLSGGPLTTKEAVYRSQWETTASLSNSGTLPTRG